VRDAQLRVLAVSHNVFGIEFTVRHHLRQRHHGGGVGANRIRRNHIDIGIFSGLRRRDAAVDAHRSLFYICQHCHNSPILF
jgi:hypothetical protein